MGSETDLKANETPLLLKKKRVSIGKNYRRDGIKQTYLRFVKVTIEYGKDWKNSKNTEEVLIKKK